MANMFDGASALTQTLCWDTAGKDVSAMFASSSGSVDGSGTGACEPTDAPSASPSASPVADVPCADASDCPPGSSCAMDVSNTRRRRMQPTGGADSRRRLFFDDSSKKEGKCTA
jgi:hypothetical protein